MPVVSNSVFGAADIAGARSLGMLTMVENSIMETIGRNSKTDGLGAKYFYDPASTLADDGGITCFVQTANTSGVGAWIIKPENVKAKTIYNAANGNAKAFATNYRPSLTKEIRVSVTVSIAVASTLLAAQTGTATLEMSPDGSTNWVEETESGNGLSGVLANGNQSAQLQGTVPRGYWYRISKTPVGTLAIINVIEVPA